MGIPCISKCQILLHPGCEYYTPQLADRNVLGVSGRWGQGMIQVLVSSPTFRTAFLPTFRKFEGYHTFTNTSTCVGFETRQVKRTNFRNGVQGSRGIRFHSRSAAVHDWRKIHLVSDIADPHVHLTQTPDRLLVKRGVGRTQAASEIVQPGTLDDVIQNESELPTSVSCGSKDEATALSDDQRWRVVKNKLGGILSNAERYSQGVRNVGHSLGVDVGDSRTGVAISLKGFSPRPLTVLNFKGEILIKELLQIARRERADEFIVGLPTSFDGKENLQSNKTRSFAGKLATQAALRGWRVYLMDEYGSSQDGMGYMLEMGIKKQSRKAKLDAYAALVVLHTYFSSKGAGAKLVVPKGLMCQERLCIGDISPKDDGFDF